MSLICVSSPELALSSYLIMAKVELGRENEGTHLHHSCCKIKDWIQREIMLMLLIDQTGAKGRWQPLFSWLILSPFFWVVLIWYAIFFTLFLGCTSLVRHLFFFLGSYFFGTSSFLSSSLWVILLWHAIFPLLFLDKERLSV